MYEVENVTNILDEIIAYEAKFRKRREQKLIQAEKEPERDFAMERSKLEAQREDAADERRELAREDFQARLNKMIDLEDEAIRLMVRDERGEDFARNTEPQDNAPSGAVKSER